MMPRPTAPSVAVVPSHAIVVTRAFDLLEPSLGGYLVRPETGGPQV
jgi:hypothetical protein